MMNLADFLTFLLISLLLVVLIKSRQNLRKNTGGQLNKYLQRWEVYAPNCYQKIRETNDVYDIAQNTKLSTQKISKIKDHIFFKQHQLDNEIRRFDPDPDIADAWLRLQKGNHTDQDLMLLEHEYFEARFEGIFRTDYRTAHNATINSGRIWTP